MRNWIDNILTILGVAQTLDAFIPPESKTKGFNPPLMVAYYVRVRGTYYLFTSWFMTQMRLVTDTVAQAAANVTATILTEIRSKTSLRIEHPNSTEDNRRYYTAHYGLQRLYDVMENNDAVLLNVVQRVLTKASDLEDDMASLTKEVAELKTQLAAIRLYLVTNVGDEANPFATAEAMVRHSANATADRVRQVKIDRIYDAVGTYDASDDAIEAPVVKPTDMPSTE